MGNTFSHFLPLCPTLRQSIGHGKPFFVFFQWVQRLRSGFKKNDEKISLKKQSEEKNT
jgi:hypothetical protein